MSAMIDEETWEQFSAKLSNLEAQTVLRDLVDYDQVKTWEGGVAFFSKGREFLTFNVTRKGLRIYSSFCWRAL